MKKKVDHITNSSSASFILSVDSDTTELNVFKEYFNKVIKQYIAEYKWSLENDGVDVDKLEEYIVQYTIVDKKVGTVFDIETSIAMYNYLDDIPQWMRYIILNLACGFDITGFKEAKIRIIEGG